MKQLFGKSLDLVDAAKTRITKEFNASLCLVTEMVNQLPFFISAERSDSYSDKHYDEKHYFVVPYRLSERGVALHSMRCLPNGVSELNDLPKRRIFHFSKELDEVLIRNALVNEAKQCAENRNDKVSSLESLANDIDSLDKKLTYGMLCIGGLAAIINPAAGAGIAAKALFPGLGGLLAKYTLRPVGEKLTESQLKSEIKAAEKKVINDFESAETIKVINPLLQELELALNTDESEHDPLFDFNLGQLDIVELDGDRWRSLTVTAIKHLYQEVLNDKARHKDACLGPEDIRWLTILLK